MKNIIISILLLCCSITSFSQGIWFEVTGIKSDVVSQEVLQTAKSMKDINEGYPSSWIKDSEYISTEISILSNGKEFKASGVNDVFTEEQKSILAKADLFEEIIVEVKYKNIGSGNIDIKTMNFTVTVSPKNEAKYCEGYEQLREYLTEAVIDKVPESSTLQKEGAMVSFTIDENGEIINAKIEKSSTEKKVDILLLNAIKNMPKWNPAETLDGTKLKQDFEFVVGMNGC